MLIMLEERGLTVVDAGAAADAAEFDVDVVVVVAEAACPASVAEADAADPAAWAEVALVDGNAAIRSLSSWRNQLGVDKPLMCMTKFLCLARHLNVG